jgi:hypothetical protein
MSAKDDRPGVPESIEAMAIEMFKAHSKGITGHEWKWEESSQDVRNIWRIKALLRT